MKLIMISLTLTSIFANPTKPIVKTLDDTFYTANNTCYTAEYDIVDVCLPLNVISDKVFFIQADIKNNIHKGAFVLDLHLVPNGNYHNVTARKLLENGKCITSDDKNVYFGTTDGIYIYNNSKNEVERYGTITANIKDIETHITEDLIYIVTEDNRLYKVTEGGNKMVEHETIKNVQEIVTDASNNLYFYEKHEDPERNQLFYEKYGKPKVSVGNTIANISGLPNEYTNMKLVKIWGNNVAIVVLNNMFYTIYSNGSTSQPEGAFLDLPTAYSIEIGLIQIYAHHKKLYCYVLDLGPVLGAALEALFQAIGDNFFPD